MGLRHACFYKGNVSTQQPGTWPMEITGTDPLPAESGLCVLGLAWMPSDSTKHTVHIVTEQSYLCTPLKEGHRHLQERSHKAVPLHL